MLDSSVTKMIARIGERELVDSSYTEMENFVVNGVRPDFVDEHILAIKFVLSTDESLEDAEETSWFVNPVYAQYLVKRIPNELDNKVFHISDYFYAQAYGPQLASEFLPELLLIIPNYPTFSILDKYSEFRISLMSTENINIEDEEKYKLFIEWLKDNI